MIQLREDNPIRHGFKAIGVRHDAHTGYHTGPCGGVNYPHLGLSDRGTKWAHGEATRHLAQVESAIARLATNPPLTWYPSVRGKHDFSKPVEIKYGDDSNSFLHNDGRPSYKWFHKQKMADLEYAQADLERTLKAYDEVLTNYDPAKYPPRGAKTKEKTVHWLQHRSHSRFGEWDSPACRFTRGASAASKYTLTADKSKVTCGPCKKLIK